MCHTVFLEIFLCVHACFHAFLPAYMCTPCAHAHLHAGTDVDPISNITNFSSVEPPDKRINTRNKEREICFHSETFPVVFVHALVLIKC